MSFKRTEITLISDLLDNQAFDKVDINISYIASGMTTASV
jgi:hypothetical protein